MKDLIKAVFGLCVLLILKPWIALFDRVFGFEKRRMRRLYAKYFEEA